MFRAFLQKCLIFGFAVFLLTAAPGQAFLFALSPLEKAAVMKLTDEKLVDLYIDVLIELEAVNSFYNNAGFTPKEYAKYKALLRFRTDLFLEMRRREIDPPAIK